MVIGGGFLEEEAPCELDPEEDVKGIQMLASPWPVSQGKRSFVHCLAYATHLCARRDSLEQGPARAHTSPRVTLLQEQRTSVSSPVRCENWAKQRPTI